MSWLSRPALDQARMAKDEAAGSESLYLPAAPLRRATWFGRLADSSTAQIVFTAGATAFLMYVAVVGYSKVPPRPPAAERAPADHSANDSLVANILLFDNFKSRQLLFFG